MADSREGVVGADPDIYRQEEGAELRQALGEGPLLAQGPMGTLLMSEPGGEHIPPVAWNLYEPVVVERLHALYAASGADILITNSFQANERALAHDEIYASVREANALSVRLARKAGARFVLGSIGPNGIDWLKRDSPEFRHARAAYREQISALLVEGASGIMLETVTSLRALEPALAAAADIAAGMPTCVSFAVNEQGDLLLDGTPLEAAVLFAEKRGAASVGVNCCSLETADKMVPRLLSSALTPVSVRPNAGDPERDDDGVLVWHEDPEAFVRAARSWIDAGVRLLGACCGTTPLTTCALRDVIDEA